MTRIASKPAAVLRLSARDDDDPFLDSADEQAGLAMRVLDVFQYFRETRHAARASEVSRALGLPNSSVDKLLKALVRRGYLRFDAAERRYAPTQRVVRAAADVEAAFHGGPALRRVTEELHAATGRTVCLCTQNDCWVQNVATLPGAHYLPAIHGEGMRSPVLGSAPGNALMAMKSDAEVMDIAQRARDRGYLELDLLGGGALLEAIRRARAEGYAAWPGFSYPGAVAIAVAVQPAPDAAPAAVVLIGDNPARSESRDRELGQMVRNAVARHFAGGGPGFAPQ